MRWCTSREMRHSRQLVGTLGVLAAVVLAVVTIAFLWPFDDSEQPAEGFTVPAATGNFSVGATRLRLPPKCRPAPVRRRLLEMLTLFNTGDGNAFVEHLATPDFHPYTSQIAGIGFQDRDQIIEFIADRHAAGDAWSATRLYPPQAQASGPHKAIYGLEIVVSQHGERIRRPRTGSKIVVDCRTGLVLTWVGPAYGPADMPSLQT